jgi:hypothetical protein
MPLFKLSKTEVTVLGVSAAGWIDLIKDAGNRYQTVHSWNRSPLRDDIYSAYKHHTNFKRISNILQLKGKIDNTIKQRLSYLSNEIMALLSKLPNEINHVLWKRYCEFNGEVVDDGFLHEYFHSKKHNLVTLCRDSKLEFEDFITTLIVTIFKSNTQLGNTLPIEIHESYHLFHEFHQQLILGIDKLRAEDNKTDHNLLCSKKIIIDTLQENVMRFNEGKALIPIEMVIVKNDSHGRDFYPDLNSIILKKDKYYSSAELRMVYKLMEEIPDKKIRSIMRHSFFLKEIYSEDSEGYKFRTIINPWDSHELVGGGLFWRKRPRKENQASYAARTKKSIPVWVKMLMNINNDYQTKKSVANKCSQSTHIDSPHSH